MQTQRPSRPGFFAALLIFAILTSGCGESTAPGAGAIRVTVTTTGEPIDRDPDGYTLSIDDRSARPVDIVGTVIFEGVSEGTHLIHLGGLAVNCTPFGGDRRYVDVSSQSPAGLVFVVTCNPNAGSVHVSTATSGTDLDPDGYDVSISGVESGGIPANGTRDFSGIQIGDATVGLSGMSGNCTIDGANPRTVSIAYGKFADVPFTVKCTPAGSIQLTTTTTGSFPDPNGYELELRQGGNQGKRTALLANGSVNVPGLLGTYVLTLFDIMPNCDVTPNPRTVTVTVGSATPVAVDIACGTPKDLAFVSNDGANADIYSIATNGTSYRRITTNPVSDVDPAWSPDGSRIAFTSERDGNREIYVMNADGSNPLRLTNSPAPDDRPAWSPDGTRIAFVSSRDGSADIYVMNADGANVVRLTNNSAYDADPAWSPDGSRIAFSSDRDVTSAIWVMNADGSAPTRLTGNIFPRGDRQPAWSPDGTRIAFSRTSTSNSDIYVVKPDGTEIVQITHGIDNAADPTWSPDGRKIALGSETSYCGWYDYDCGPVILVVSADGGQYYSLETGGSNPAWRP